MRIVLAAVLASAVSSSNGFAEDARNDASRVVVPHEDIIATSHAEDRAGFAIVAQNEEQVVESDDIQSVFNDIPAVLETEFDNQDAPIVDIPDLVKIDESFEGRSGLLDDVESPEGSIEYLDYRGPPLEQSVKEMFSQLKKSVYGVMESAEIPRKYIEKNQGVFLYILLAGSLVSVSDPMLKTTLLEGSFTTGISQCIIFDMLRSIVDRSEYREEEHFNENSIAEISELQSAAEAENRCEERLTLKAMSDVLRAPSTQFAVKEMLEGFKKSIIGLMTLKDIPRLEEALPFILIATILACDMQFQARLFESGLPHFFLYDVVKSTLSNGGLIPKMSHYRDERKKNDLIKIVSVLASFMLIGAPSKSLWANFYTGMQVSGLLELVKWAWFGDIIGRKK